MFIPSLHDNTLLEDIINPCQSNSRLCFWCIVRRRFEPPSSSFYRHTLNMAKVHLLAFFPNASLLTTIFLTISPPVKYGISAKMNLWRWVICSCLENYKTTLCFFVRNRFVSNTRLNEISDIRRSLKKNDINERFAK